MQNRLLVHISLILFMVFCFDCSKRPSDNQIQNDIHAKVATDPETEDSDVTVTAKHGNVALEGKVKTAAARKKVEEIARAEPGVSELDDETLVEPNVGTETAVPADAASQTMERKEPTAPPPPPPPIVVPAGTVLTVRTDQTLSSKTSQTGQTFLATLAQPVSVGGRAALPAGSTVRGRVVNAKAKGKIKGEGQLDLALTGISVGDHTYLIETGVLSSTEKGKGKRTAATTGGGAAGGALIGGLAGGGKGAGIGALVGAGAGFVGGAVTGNKQIEIPAESALSFTLTRPLTLQPSS
ncbi:MAG TPA: BON domain-containing protein [Terriglobales bacterium]|nr:BON domain-containing protein [Terriglobales bacterium]